MEHCEGPDDWNLVDEFEATQIESELPADVEGFVYQNTHDRYGNYYKCASAHMLGQHKTRIQAIDFALLCGRTDCNYCRAIETYKALSAWGYNHAENEYLKEK